MYARIHHEAAGAFARNALQNCAPKATHMRHNAMHFTSPQGSDDAREVNFVLDVKNDSEPMRLVTSHDLKLVPIDPSRDTLVSVAHTTSAEEDRALFVLSGQQADEDRGR